MPCKLELAEEKSKLAQLGQQNGFGPAFSPSLFDASKRHSQINSRVCYFSTIWGFFGFFFKKKGLSNFYSLKEKEDDSGFLCIILSIFTLKIARTVTGSVDEMRAPNVRQTRYGIEYVQPNNPKTHLQQNHSAHSSVPYSAEFDQEMHNIQFHA